MTNTSVCVCVCMWACVGSVRFGLGSNARPTLNISTFQQASVFLQSKERKRRRCGFQMGREKSCCKYQIIRIKTLSLPLHFCIPLLPIGGSNHMLNVGVVKRVATPVFMVVLSHNCCQMMCGSEGTRRLVLSKSNFRKVQSVKRCEHHLKVASIKQ